MDISINFNYTKTHAFVTIIHRGYQWQAEWAKEWNEMGDVVSPTEDQVKEAFLEDRNSFDKYSVK